jgi:type IV secretion system protein VirD4
VSYGTWGPQRTGGVPMPIVKSGGHWVAIAIVAVVVGLPVSLMTAVISWSSENDPGAQSTLAFFGFVGWCIAGVFALVGWREGRRGEQFMHARWVSLVVLVLVAWKCVLLYGIGWGLARWRSKHGPLQKPWAKTIDEYQAVLPPGDRGFIVSNDEPLWAAMAANTRGKPVPGGHLGWSTDFDEAISASPREAVLVLGRPGSGKTSAVIIPSVLIAPGAAVASSVKTDVMNATWKSRSRLGKVWHLRLGDEEPTPQGVVVCRWSPLVGIRTWDDARIMASRIAAPAMKASKDGGDGGDHFLERGRDWLECLLYAAVLGEYPISKVADWALNPDSDETQQQVGEQLTYAAGNGDGGAGIAKRQLDGLLAIPDRERGSIKSTLTRLLRIYGSVTARKLGDAPNFDPKAFVRSGNGEMGSGDTLYITAPPDKQQELAPLVAGLLEAIRYATYERAAAIAAGREQPRPHVSFVLDECANTAPIPLNEIVAEAGGQGLHLVVGLQDLSQARVRWGRAADGFLTLFGTKLVLPGVMDEQTLRTFSDASGEYDRQMQSYSVSTQNVGEWNIPRQTVSPSFSTVRQKVLTPGDIANIPHGCGLLYRGAVWELIRIGMHWQAPWTTVLDHAENRHYLYSEDSGPQLVTTHPTLALPREEQATEALPRQR